MRTKGRPIPSPTPRPTLTVSVLELSLAGDAVAGDVGPGDVEAGSELLFESVLEVEVAAVLVVKEVDDVKAVDGLELDEL